MHAIRFKILFLHFLQTSNESLETVKKTLAARETELLDLKEQLVWT